MTCRVASLEWACALSLALAANAYSQDIPQLGALPVEIVDDPMLHPTVTSTASAVEEAAPESSTELKIISGSPELEAPLPKITPTEDDGSMLVDWASVLDLARASSLEIRLATEKVHEADVMTTLARLQWIPSLKVGTSYLNTSGRRQLIEGDIIEASKSNLYAGGLLNATLDARKVCVDVLRAKQQVSARVGELDRLTRAEIQKVSNAYIDLVAAQAGAAISVEVAGYIEDLVQRSKQLRDQGFGTDVDVLRNETGLQAQKIFETRAKQAQRDAATQLVMLLNLPPGTKLRAAWDYLTPVTLVDENQPEDQLVAQAYSQGPGMAEVAALLNSLDEQQRQLKRIALIPTLQAGTGYGAFGGGAGDYFGNFGNRLDVNVGAYWDVLSIVGTSHTRELFNSKRAQANIEHQKLMARLAAGVIVARNRAITSKQMIADAENQVHLAINSYLLSKKRMDAAVTSSLEVLPFIASLGDARKNYLSFVIEYNKAQIELMYLLGQQANCSCYQEPSSLRCRYINGQRVEVPAEAKPIPGQASPSKKLVPLPNPTPTPSTSLIGPPISPSANSSVSLVPSDEGVIGPVGP